MRNYIDPEMNISKFSVTDIVTTSVGDYQENTELTNKANAEAYLASKSIAVNNILSFE